MHKALLAAAMALLVTTAWAQTPPAPSGQQLTIKDKNPGLHNTTSKRNGDESKQAKQKAPKRALSPSSRSPSYYPKWPKW